MTGVIDIGACSVPEFIVFVSCTWEKFAGSFEDGIKLFGFGVIDSPSKFD